MLFHDRKFLPSIFVLALQFSGFDIRMNLHLQSRHGFFAVFLEGWTNRIDGYVLA